MVSLAVPLLADLATDVLNRVKDMIENGVFLDKEGKYYSKMELNVENSQNGNSGGKKAMGDSLDGF